jgi:O-antigen/teichoic acid export membrane protein
VWSALSYLAHPYRPRFSLAARRQLWSFSRWIPLQNLGIFLKDRADSFAVGRFAGSTPLGVYGMSSRISGIASDEIAWPLWRVLFPVYSRLGGEPDRLARAYGESIAGLALLLLPATAGIALVADVAVPLFLGPQWNGTIPVLRLLAIYIAVAAVAASAWQVLMALGRLRTLTGWVWSYMAVYIGALLLCGRNGNLLAVAAVKVGCEVLFAPFLFRALSAATPIRAHHILAALWRPLIATTVMLAAVLAARSAGLHSPVAALAVQVGSGALAYAGAAAALWIVAGRPPGPELTAFQYARRWRRRRRESPQG